MLTVRWLLYWNAPLKLNRDGQSLVQPIRFMVDE